MNLLIKIYRKGQIINARNFAIGENKTIDKNSLNRYKNYAFNYRELSAYLSAKH